MIRSLRRWLLLIGCLLALALAIGGSAMASTVEDTIAQRAKPCISCHGDEGRATPDGYYPRIAGKPAGYLLHQLQGFRDGRRANAAMAYLLHGMPDRYLEEFAEYFASQHPPYDMRSQPKPDAAVEALGKTLVLQGDAVHGIPACGACHGADLTGQAPDIPGLIGLPATYLASQLGAWRVGLRHARTPDCMAQIANRLDLQQVNAAIAYISIQVPSSPSAPAGAAGTVKLPLVCGSVSNQAAQP